MNPVKDVSHISESHNYNVNLFFGEHLNKSFTDFLRIVSSLQDEIICLWMLESDASHACYQRDSIWCLLITLSLQMRFFFFFLLDCLFIFCLYLFWPFPSFALTPFLWLAVSLGLCTFQAGNSEALSKHQLPRSAQRNPSWLPLRCRPPCTLNFSSTAFLTYKLLEHHPWYPFINLLITSFLIPST